MNIFLKTALILYVILDVSWRKDAAFTVIVLLLLITAATILKERFIDTISLAFVIMALAGIAVYMDGRLGVLLGLPVFDFMYKKAYVGAAGILIIGGTVLIGEPGYPMLLMIISLYGLLAYVIQLNETKEKRYIQSLDEERRLRYELEQTKLKLLHSSKEIANLAELKERNRIAREIHDSVGHQVAGVFIHLQAASKLFGKDSSRALELLEQSIRSLSQSIETMRETVHNIKPQETPDIEYFKNIVNHFSFCPVDLRYSGDFTLVPATHLEIIATNLKEAMTNSAKYSGATRMEVAIDVKPGFTRLYVKDNGRGCVRIVEGLGLSGIRERIRSIGGSLSVNANDGFMIVCVLPHEEGGGVFESVGRR